MKISKVKDIMDKKQAGITGLIFGFSGTGKTWLAAMSPKPLIILTERNGITSIGHANPDATIAEVSSADELFEIVLQAKNGYVEYNKQKIYFDTLVVDSLTECQRLIRDRILQRNKREEMILKDWNTLANHMERFVRALRDLPVHVICTALCEKYHEDSSGKIHVQPMFDGKKTGQQISQYFNFVGYYFRKEAQKDGLYVRSLMFDGPSNYACKSAHPIVGIIENPSLKDILNKLQTYTPNK